MTKSLPVNIGAKQSSYKRRRSSISWLFGGFGDKTEKKQVEKNNNLLLSKSSMTKSLPASTSVKRSSYNKRRSSIRWLFKDFINKIKKQNKENTVEKQQVEQNSKSSSAKVSTNPNMTQSIVNMGDSFKGTIASKVSGNNISKTNTMQSLYTSQSMGRSSNAGRGGRGDLSL